MTDSDLHIKQFFEAASIGDRLKLTELIRVTGCVPDELQNSRGETVLHVASQHGHTTLVRLLVEVYGCSLEKRDYAGNTSYHTACLYGQLQVFMCMLRITSRIPPLQTLSLKDFEASTPFHKACQSGCLPLARLFVELMCTRVLLKRNLYNDDHRALLIYDIVKGAVDFNAHAVEMSTNECGHTPIHVACRFGHISIVKYFFEEVVLFLKFSYAPSQFVSSLLRIACIHNRSNIVKYLHQIKRVEILQCQPKFSFPFHHDSRNEESDTTIDTVLHSTARCGHVDLLKYLLDHECTNPHLLVGRNKDKLLHAACVSDNTALVELLINDYKCDVNAKNGKGDSVLHSACEWGSLNLVKFFVLNKCIDINVTDDCGKSPLHVALCNQNYEVCHFLLEREDCDVNIQTITTKETALHLVSCTEDYNMIDLILKKNCHSQGVVDSDGDTPLFNACRIGCFEIVKLLIRNGCDPCIINSCSKETPAHIACRLHNLMLLSTIMESYSDQLRNQQNLLGNSLLHYTCTNDASDIVEYLVKNNLCDVNLTNLYGETALHLAIPHNLETTKLLISVPQQKSFNVRDTNGNTVLHYACKLKSIEVVKLIADRNTSSMQPLCSIANNEGLTPLHVATVAGALNILQFFFDSRFCDSTQTSGNGSIPLHYACTYGHTEIVEFLEGDFQMLNSDGETPLFCALKHYHFDLAKLILSKKRFDPKRPVMVIDPSQYKTLNMRQHRQVSSILGHLNETQPIELPLLHSLCDIALSMDTGYEQFDITFPPLSSQEFLGMMDMLRYVISHGIASVFDKDSSKNTILHVLSALSSHDTMFRELSTVLCDSVTNKNVNSTESDYVNSNGDSPLHIACSINNICMIKLLLENKLVSINCKNAKGKTPIQVVRHNPILDYLIAHGANPAEIWGSRHYKYFLDQSRRKHDLSVSVGVVVVGNSRAGKTSLVKYLTQSNIQNCTSETSDSTAGVVTTDYEMKGIGKFTFYDTGGQPEFHSVNSACLQSLFEANTPLLIILVVDCSLQEAKIHKQIQYWVSYLKSCQSYTSSQQSTLLIGSRGDCLEPKEHENKEDFLNGIIKDASDSHRMLNKAIVLDCRQPSTQQNEALLHVLKSRYSLIKEEEIDIRCYSLFAYLCEWFPDDPVKLSTVQKKIKTYRDFQDIDRGVLHFYATGRDIHIPIPYAIEPLVELLKSLQARQHLILLKEGDDSQDYWILTRHVKTTMYHKVVKALFAPKDFGNTLRQNFNVGVVPSSAIAERVSEFKLELTAMLKFLIYSEHCAKIEDPKTHLLLQSGHLDTGPGLGETSMEQMGLSGGPTVQGEVESMNNEAIIDHTKAVDSEVHHEDYYFFPDLINSDKAPDTWLPSSDHSYCCGWVQCCSMTCDYFTPRFIQVLLLRFIFMFAVNSSSDSGKDLRRECKIWRNGVFWATTQGVEVLAEVIEQNTAIVLLMRCVEFQEMEAVKLRSAVIRQVNEVREKYCSNVKIEEYFLHPDHVSKVSFHSSNDLEVSPRISLKQIIRSIKNGQPFVLDSASRPVNLNSKLLYFEPYCGVGGNQKVFQLIFDPSNGEKEIPDKVLYDIAALVYKAGSRQTQLVHMLEIPPGEAAEYEKMEPVNIQRQLFKMFQYAISTYQDLHRKFEEFSIFSQRNHLIGGPAIDHF